jgi:uncharacterized protein (DUF433 family)
MKAHREMAKALNTPYPFAQKDMYIDNFKLLFGDDTQLITADEKLQTVIASFLQPFCQKIEFTNDRIAHKFYPIGQDKSIVINPENQFGQPVIEGTNILTTTILAFHKGGESEDSISRLYDITPKNVRDALEYHKAA